MKIHLDERELKQAIEQYIGSQGIDLSQREIDIQLTAGRGSRGHYADIVLVEQGADTSADPFADDSPEGEESTDSDPDPAPDDSAINFD